MKAVPVSSPPEDEETSEVEDFLGEEQIAVVERSEAVEAECDLCGSITIALCDPRSEGGELGAVKDENRSQHSFSVSSSESEALVFEESGEFVLGISIMLHDFSVFESLLDDSASVHVPWSLLVISSAAIWADGGLVCFLDSADWSLSFSITISSRAASSLSSFSELFDSDGSFLRWFLL